MKELFFSEKGIYYRINEFEEGKSTLVFIHGLSGSSSSWTEYEKRLESNYNILNLDLRGHGTSKRYRNFQDYKLENITEDIRDLLQYLHIDKCILFI